MAAGKWISNLKGTTPIADAARRVLTVRLEVVRHYLPLAQHFSFTRSRKEAKTTK